MNSKAVGGWQDRLRVWFPDREFFMRSQGQVRFIKISSRLQIAAAALTAALLLVWVVTMAAMAISQYVASRDRLALLNREAQVASAESRVGAYRQNLDTVAHDLARRQSDMEKLVEAYVGPLPDDERSGDNRRLGGRRPRW